MSLDYLSEIPLEDDGFLIQSEKGEDCTRRTFLQIVGSGLLLTVVETPAGAQSSNSASAGSAVVRLYLKEDGKFIALSGKVEEGQGPRTELSQAAAEELGVPLTSVELVMADTHEVPDDGITAGSRTTPRNVPQMRRAAATARELLKRLAAEEWDMSSAGLTVERGLVKNPNSEEAIGYTDLASERKLLFRILERNVRNDIPLTRIADWKVLGKPARRPNIRDLVTGQHLFPSDIVRPGMLYGAILRPPSFGATLEAVDLSSAEQMEDVTIVREGSFVGVVGPSSFLARRSLEEIGKAARWTLRPDDVSHRNIHQHLIENARRDRARGGEEEAVEEGLTQAKETLEATYTLAYIQHAPMEPRAAVAEWEGDRLTVWVGCDGPFRARAHLAEELGIAESNIRVIVPDMGGGFGGKHTSEPAVEAARLARKVGKPVWVRWSREEEFTWAYSRPAAVIECKAGVGADGKIVAWDFANINGGGAAIETPYEVPAKCVRAIGSDSPIRQGSYRCLGATGSNFARESFMDELAVSAGIDPLEFRLAHLKDDRMRTVLTRAAEKFGWSQRYGQSGSSRGVGLACGTEKNSYVAACVEVKVDRQAGKIEVLEVCETFECGPILNPDNLRAQVEGCICMGLGGALSEELEFDDGKILNPSFSRYRVPRFRDVPKIDVHLINNKDIDPAGGGETPIIAIAPAIGNAVYAATKVRLRAMPMNGLS